MVGVRPEDDPHFILLLDPFSVPAEAIISGLDYAFPRAAKIGGLASGGRSPNADALFLDDMCYRDGAVGLSLFGDIIIDTVVAQGCKPIGETMRITSAQDNALLEIDGNPSIRALELTYEHLAESEQALIQNSLFLGIAMDPLEASFAPGGFLIRNVIGADPNSGALYIGSHLHEGQLVQFHVHDADTSAADLRDCLQSYVRDVHGSPAVGALLFSCVGRGTNLYKYPNHDVGIFRDVVGGLPVGGFFCNGEIGPVGGVTYLHGFTSCFGLFRPKVALRK
jgi:small ligand-binding sensory domain FIST